MIQKTINRRKTLFSAAQISLLPDVALTFKLATIVFSQTRPQYFSASEPQLAAESKDCQTPTV
jgi:hypothetical protein